MEPNCTLEYQFTSRKQFFDEDARRERFGKYRMLLSLRRSCPPPKNNRSVRWRRLPIPSPAPVAAIPAVLPVILRFWKQQFL